jgi:pyruvate dehydrogenase E2 component (dihydrolipoamide acetyltransferase)
MLKTFTLNDLAPELDDATVAAWHVKTGDYIWEDDDLLEVVTDKAAITIPCPAEGSVIRCECQVKSALKNDDAVITLDIQN